MSTAQTLSSFIQDAPPGEVEDVKSSIVSLVEGNNQLVSNLDTDVAEYNTNQFAIANVHGTKTVISDFNKQSNGDFFDPVSGKTFSYDHSSNKASVTGEYSGQVSPDIKTLAHSIRSYQDEHYPSDAAFGVFPQDSGEVVVALVDNKYNPGNFWNGRWKSYYKVDLSSNQIVGGAIDVDVHYFEDGNVRLKCSKQVSSTKIQVSVAHSIAQIETAYQTELNKTFVGLNENSFKNLRRQLPVTRAKMNWAKPLSDVILE